MDKIDWQWLSINQNIFEIDKTHMKYNIHEQAQKININIY